MLDVLTFLVAVSSLQSTRRLIGRDRRELPFASVQSIVRVLLVNSNKTFEDTFKLVLFDWSLVFDDVELDYHASFKMFLELNLYNTQYLIVSKVWSGGSLLNTCMCVSCTEVW